ncbi:TPA: hypothetical protein ACUNBL_004521, partial [Stenotrophomonas maltophilia]
THTAPPSTDFRNLSELHSAPVGVDLVCRNGIPLRWVSTLVDTVDPRHAWMNAAGTVDGWNRLGI